MTQFRKVIAGFDFCNTLVAFESADDFVYFCLAKAGRKPPIFREAFRRLLKASKILRGPQNKRWILAYLKGLKIDELERYASSFIEEKVLPNLNLAVYQRLEEHKRSGHELVLVSGGYSIYLRDFAKRVGCFAVIGTEVEFSNGICTGNISGENCMGEEKVKKTLAMFPSNDFDFEKSYFYTDHPSDIPMLKLFGVGTVVIRKEIVYPEFLDGEYKEIHV